MLSKESGAGAGPTRRLRHRRSAAHKISAYIIMHNDHDILAGALGSIADFVDEIVVVDGAYEWLAPFFIAAGLDPSRSTTAGLNVLRNAAGAEKIRYYNGVWKDELSKRSFAYSQCSHPIVYLLDADEIHLVDHHRLSAFLSSDRSVGCLDSPLLFSDEALWNSTDGQPVGRKPIVFKKEAFDDAEHLGALWLVISDEERRALPRADAGEFFEPALGVNYHLSLLRTYRTAVHRCRFYCLRYCLAAGRISWFPGLEVKTSADLAGILGYLSPRDFDIFMWGHPITIGFHQQPNAAVAPIPIPARARTTVRETYRTYRQGVRRLAHITRDDHRILLNGVEHHIDITDEAQSLRGQAAAICVQFEEPVEALSARSYAAHIGGAVVAGEHRVLLDGAAASFDAEHVSVDGRSPDRLVIGLTARWSRHDRVFMRLIGLRARGR